MAFLSKAGGLLSKTVEGATSGGFTGAAKAAKAKWSAGQDLIRAKGELAKSDADTLSGAIKGMKDRGLANKVARSTGLNPKTGMVGAGGAKASPDVLGGFGGGSVSKWQGMSRREALNQMTNTINAEGIMTTGDKAMTAYTAYRGQAQLRDPGRGLMRLT